MVQATIIGARGYLGRELLRLLTHHPEVDMVHAASTSTVGEPIRDHIGWFRGKQTFVAHDDDAALDADVVFLATPGGEAAGLVQTYEAAGVKTVIDLSRDHRLAALRGEDRWIYGLADVLPTPKGANRIANPGCYPTASLLAMAPALQNNLVAPGPIIVDGKSGVSGAGVSPRADLHFPEMNESVRAYNVLGHDHTDEMSAAAGRLNGGIHPVRFTPHLVPQTRGLLSTVYMPYTGEGDVEAAYEQAYADHPFVDFGREPSTNTVRLSNNAQVDVDVDEHTGLIVARCAIDNLVKGGSGTAVQNMNLAFGFDPSTGLLGTGGGL